MEEQKFLEKEIHHLEKQLESEKDKPQINTGLDKSKLFLPASILIAAALISGSLLYTKAGSSKNLAGAIIGGQQVPQPGAKVNVDVGHLPPKGSSNAKVKIVEFGDFRCPFCDRFFKDTEPQLLKEYINTGKVVFYFRQYQFLGPASVMAGNAAECANEQGKFWAFHDYLYQNQPSESDTSMYTVDNMTKVAGQLGLNSGQFKSCLASQKYNQKVQDDLAAGQQAGVSGTPTTFINGRILVGAQPYSSFKALIDEELEK